MTLQIMWCQVRLSAIKVTLGEIILFNSNLYWSRNDKYYLNSKWRGRRKDDGGVVMNQGIHNLDLFQYFFGKVKSVFVEKIKINYK